MTIFFKFLKKKIKKNFLYIFYINFRGSIRTTMGLTKRKKLSGLNDILKFFIIRSIFGLTYFRNKIGIRKSDDIIEYKNFTSILRKNSILKIAFSLHVVSIEIIFNSNNTKKKWTK